MCAKFLETRDWLAVCVCEGRPQSGLAAETRGELELESVLSV